MNKEPQNQTATRQPFVLRWLVWGLLILIGGSVLVALVAAFVVPLVDGLDSRMLPLLLAVVLFVPLFFALKATFHPLRGRPDERHSWQERFPTHTDQEVQRFLQVVGKMLGIREKNLCQLRADDRVTALTQEWLCGDGMDIVELVMAIEEEYALELPDTFLEQARTLGDLFDYVTRHSAGRPPSAPSGRSNQAKSG